MPRNAIPRQSFPCLLVLGALFGGLACSVGGGSKISKSDVDKLNAANTKIWSSEFEVSLEVDSCLDNPAFSRQETKCQKRWKAKYLVGMRSALASYEQIAKDADGKCREALRKVTRDIRGEVAQTTSDIEQMKALKYWSSNPKRLKKDVNAVAGACALKVIKGDDKS